jgi:hypothetical protein
MTVAILFTCDPNVNKLGWTRVKGTVREYFKSTKSEMFVLISVTSGAASYISVEFLTLSLSRQEGTVWDKKPSHTTVPLSTQLAAGKIHILLSLCS